MSQIDKEIKKELEKLNSPAFLLTRLWRKVLLEYGMTTERFDELMSIYVAQPGMTRKQETDSRGKLRQALASPKMTLLMLLNGLRMMKATKITFALRVEFLDRPPVTVEDSIIIMGQTKETVSEPTVH
jgi:hypothetical protein